MLSLDVAPSKLDRSTEEGGRVGEKVEERWRRVVAGQEEEEEKGRVAAKREGRENVGARVRV